MKKTLFRFSAIFLAILVLFVGFPFNSLNRVKAATNPATNFIDFLRTNLGIAKVDNGSLSALDRTDFVLSLYNTSLAWQDNDITFSFVPADVFTKNEWVALATSGTIPSPNFAQYDGYDLKQSLIMSDYIHDTGSGYDLSNMPKLENSVDTVSPLDGVEVISNFSNFSYGNSDLALYQSICPDYVNYIKENSSDYVIISGNNRASINGKYMYFRRLFSFAFIEPIDFSFLVKNGNYISINYYYNNVWKNTSKGTSFEPSNPFVDALKNDVRLYYNTLYDSDTNLFVASGFEYQDSHFAKYSTTSSLNLFYNNDVTVYSNKPVVFASSQSVGQNYYYWLRGVPSGNFYTTANTQIVYNYDYVNNNNWETAYNNYISDISNYYSNTENITNEQLTQYIDNSTTITNITNNYIDNSGSGGGGENPESGLILSWLEKIFDRVTDIYNTILGKDTEGDIYYNDNSIRYSIIEYPLSDLFPSVPQSRFIPYSDIFDFDIAQEHLNGVMRQIIPFCYLYQLQTIASVLASPPQAPHYEIPFVIERLNIDEQITIDLTSSAWTTIHSIWITLFMIMLIFALLYATYKFLILLNSIFG